MQRAYRGCKSEVTGVLRPTLSNSHPASKLGLILSLSIVLVRSWACPRPERFPTPCYQVLNNNIQSRILHNVIHCCKSICPIKAICDWQVLANHIRGRQTDQNPKQALRAQILWVMFYRDNAMKIVVSNTRQKNPFWIKPLFLLRGKSVMNSAAAYWAKGG